MTVSIEDAINQSRDKLTCFRCQAPLCDDLLTIDFAQAKIYYVCGCGNRGWRSFNAIFESSSVMVSEIVVYDDSPIQTRGTERQQRTSVQIADVDQALAPSALFEDDHRPSSIDEVLGDDAARAALERSINTHSVIISGQPGTGRTTMAKIIADHLQREAGPDQVAVFDARTIGDDQFDTVATREANVDSMQQVRQHIWDETLSTLRAQPDMRAEAIVAREKVAKKRVVDIADDPDSEE